MQDNLHKELLLFIMGTYGAGFLEDIFHNTAMSILVVVALFLLISIPFDKDM